MWKKQNAHTHTHTHKETGSGPFVMISHGVAERSNATTPRTSSGQLLELECMMCGYMRYPRVNIDDSRSILRMYIGFYAGFSKDTLSEPLHSVYQEEWNQPLRPLCKNA